MKWVALSFAFIGLTVSGCGNKSSLTSDEQEYVSTTLDIMKTKAKLPADTDSNKVIEALKPVYARHKSTAEKYTLQTKTLSEDPESAIRIMNAIRDSTGTR
jgi:hypothetical protein